jgi:hypothetical protein
MPTSKDLEGIKNTSVPIMVRRLLPKVITPSHFLNMSKQYTNSFHERRLYELKLYTDTNNTSSLVQLLYNLMSDGTVGNLLSLLTVDELSMSNSAKGACIVGTYDHELHNTLFSRPICIDVQWPTKANNNRLRYDTVCMIPIARTLMELME